MTLIFQLSPTTVQCVKWEAAKCHNDKFWLHLKPQILVASKTTVFDKVSKNWYETNITMLDTHHVGLHQDIASDYVLYCVWLGIILRLTMYYIVCD